MKTSLEPLESATHFLLGAPSFHRKTTSFFRTLRKLPWLDQLALMFGTTLAVATAATLSPALIPLWTLLLIKKQASPDKTVN